MTREPLYTAETLISGIKKDILSVTMYGNWNDIYIYLNQPLYKLKFPENIPGKYFAPNQMTSDMSV